VTRGNETTVRDADVAVTGGSEEEIVETRFVGVKGRDAGGE